jgi:hypothetical protein
MFVDKARSQLYSGAPELYSMYRQTPSFRQTFTGIGFNRFKKIALPSIIFPAGPVDRLVVDVDEEAVKAGVRGPGLPLPSPQPLPILGVPSGR